ncbi:MAG: M67 family metallopeptidase [Acidimicrobiia bacterium]
MTSPIPLHGEICEAMVSHARFAFPEEACGLLAGPATGDIRMAYCLSNRDRSPYRFTLDPTEHFRAMQHARRNGWHVKGVFHSHPRSAALPSATDVAGALDPDWVYVVVGLASADAVVRAFAIQDGVVRERSIHETRS